MGTDSRAARMEPARPVNGTKRPGRHVTAAEGFASGAPHGQTAAKRNGCLRQGRPVQGSWPMAHSIR